MSPIASLELATSGFYTSGYLTTTVILNRDLLFEALINMKNLFNEINK